MRDNYVRDASIAVVGMVAWVAMLHWVSATYAGGSLLLWYTQKGYAVSWLMAALTAVWGDLNKRPQLISANPLEYLGTYAQVLSTCFRVSTQVGRAGRQEPGRESLLPQGPLVRAINNVFGLILSICLDLAFLAWFFCVVPMQYFAFLVCGAPARLLLNTPVKFGVPTALWREKPMALRVDQEVPANWQVFTLHDKPVTLTGAMTAFVFWLVGYLV